MDSLLGYDQYMPHGMCLLWEPWLVMLWAGSDLMIFTAYMALPLAIVMVLRKRPDLTHRGLVSLFAGFILLCGITHAMGIVTLWYPIYPFTGAVKLATGLVSMATAVVFFRLIPIFVRIPTPDRHDEVIAKLEVTLADLSRARDELESRVRQRTDELKDANLRLVHTARDAVQRSRNLIQVVSSLTRPGVEVNEYPENFLRELRGRINALAIATSTVMEHGDSTRASLERVVRRQVEPLFANPAQQLNTEGPVIEVGAQGAQQVSLVAWELGSRFAHMSRSKQSRGRITVTWAVTTEPEKDDMLTLEWRETFGVQGKNGEDQALEGDGTLTPEPLPEFSEALLTRIVPHLLSGKGRIEIAPSTFIYRLTCPVTALDNSRNADAHMAVGDENAWDGRLLGKA
ncbi:MAG: HWE histidine kinase domain-containing protein [Erythrobacter sp.]